MAKLTLTDTAAGYSNTTVINANNALIEAALENTVSRDGSVPNVMSANFDANSNRVINVSDAVNTQDAVTLSQLNDASVVVSTVAGTGVTIADAANLYVGTTAEGCFAELAPSLTKIKASNEAVGSSTTAQQDDDLNGFAVVAGASYKFELYLYYTQNVGNFRFRLDSVGGTFTTSSMKWNWASVDSLTSGTDSIGDSETASDITTSTDGVGNIVQVAGSFINNTATTVDLLWAQETSSANDTTLLTGSYMTVTRI